MKAKREHRVPLAPRAVEIVREILERKDEYVFTGRKAGEPISNMTMLYLLQRMGVPVTVHGFRSSFRDWASERTAFAHEVCEMEAWAEFVNTPHVESTVIPLKAAA